MPDSSNHCIAIFDAAQFVASVPQQRLQLLGIGDGMRFPRSDKKTTSLSFSAHAYWFPEAARRLLVNAQAPDVLGFLADEGCTAEYVEEGDPSWPEITRCWLFTDAQKMLELASAIAALLDWCNDHPRQTSVSLWQTHDATAIKNMLAHLHLRDALVVPEQDTLIVDDTDPNFLFFGLLETLYELLVHAAATEQWFCYRSTRYELAW